MRYVIPFLALLYIFSGCKKTDNRQYSYWYINADSFASNETVLAVDKAMVWLGIGNNNRTAFTIVFNFGFQAPQSGDWSLSHTPEQHPDSVNIGFYYNGDVYHVAPSNRSALHASLVNGKVRYELPPGSFFRYGNPNDTVLIHGTFNQP